MKIWLIILSSVLAITSGLSGFYIYTLNDRIDELESQTGNKFADVGNQFTDVNDRFVDTDRQIDDAKTALEGMLKTSENRYDLALSDQAASLTDYQTATDGTLSEIQGDITSTDTKVSTIDSRVSDIRDNVLFSTDLYDKVKDTVVTISSEKILSSGYVFDRQHLGTGFLYDGKVITAYHVVEDAGNIRFTFPDGTILAGYVEIYSKELDIAILVTSYNTTEFDEYSKYLHDLPSVDLADSDNIKPGEPVFVVGSPGDGEEYRMGLQETMTSGIVSQVNRSLHVESDFRTNLIQFDAPVNFGNSGSPLFNRDGEVIGVVIARMDPAVGDGIGMAVTSNQISRVEDAIPPLGPDTPHIWTNVPRYTYHYPWSGITVKDPMTYNPFNGEFVTISGAEVISVKRPALDANVMNGDIITGLDNIEIHNSDEFYCFLADYYSVGDNVTLTLIRGKEEIIRTITLEEKP